MPALPLTPQVRTNSPLCRWMNTAHYRNELFRVFFLCELIRTREESISGVLRPSLIGRVNVMIVAEVGLHLEVGQPIS